MNVQLVIPDPLFEDFVRALNDFIARYPSHRFEMYLLEGNGMSMDEAMQIVKDAAPAERDMSFEVTKQ